MFLQNISYTQKIKFLILNFFYFLSIESFFFNINVGRDKFIKIKKYNQKIGINKKQELIFVKLIKNINYILNPRKIVFYKIFIVKMDFLQSKKDFVKLKFVKFSNIIKINYISKMFNYQQKLFFLIQFKCKNNDN